MPDCPVELKRFRGNERADQYAKLGADTHPVDQLEIDNYLLCHKDVKRTARHVVQTLSAAPPGHIDFRKTGRLTKRTTRRGMAHSKLHDFVWCRKVWTCTKCLMRCKNPTLVNSSSPHCESRSVMSVILSPSLKHRLWVSKIQGGGEVFYCSVCWCHAESYPRGLELLCKGPPDNHFKAKGFGRIAKSRVGASIHPNGKHRLYPPVRII